MADKFAWRGMPVYDDAGNVIAVQPVRGIEADDGLIYPGIVDVDADGNRFTYNQVPSDYSPIPIDILFFLNTLPRLPNTRYKILAGETIAPNEVIMA